jgi:hypothetical protein
LCVCVCVCRIHRVIWSVSLSLALTGLMDWIVALGADLLLLFGGLLTI